MVQVQTEINNRDNTNITNKYFPINGGWRIRISNAPDVSSCYGQSSIGCLRDKSIESEDFKSLAPQIVKDDPRLHSRPLFPPADKSLLFSKDQLEKLDKVPFRPIIVAYNAPRFVFDFHSAGGILGNLRLGLTAKNTAGKWFDEWEDLDVQYIDGRMEYRLKDSVFPGIEVFLGITPLADAVGAILQYEVKGHSQDLSLVSVYGGASAFFEIWAFQEEYRYAPKHCAKNELAWENGAFTLSRRFDAEDAYWKKKDDIIPIARLFSEWQAVIRGVGTSPDHVGFGRPDAVLELPGALLNSTQWVSAATKEQQSNCVTVYEHALKESQNKGYLVVGMGENIDQSILSPETAFQKALARNHQIANRIVVHTPDVHLNEAVRMLAFSTEGIWGDSSYLHGAWSWRSAYLGWRGWYGPTCYGWTDRVKRTIQTFIRYSLVNEGLDRGSLGFMLEFDPPPTFCYNMHEVFLDQVRQYFDYTGDLELMREIFPVLKSIVEWENRRLRPTEEYLYESCLNTWISDSHWYIRGQCTQASAYMLRAHTFLGELAHRLGEDASSYDQACQKIRQAIQEKLWMKRSGVFAECQDTLGHRLLHSEPELPTIYHAAEFGAADDLQIFQMLHWVETHLRKGHTPGGGVCYWNSNWFPNKGRSYTHSTYEVSYGEQMNLALTYYQFGQEDRAYALIRFCLEGIYNGLTPGGLACQAYTDGRQRSNEEFADSIGMWGRTVMEGLFGIQPRRQDGVVHLRPQFPSDWSTASISSLHFSYQWTKTATSQKITWQSPISTTVNLRLALRADTIEDVQVNGQKISWKVEAGMNMTWLILQTSPGTAGTIEVTYSPCSITEISEKSIIEGEKAEWDLSSFAISDWQDPQGLLTESHLEKGRLTGRLTGQPGPGVIFVKAGSDSCPFWLSLPVRIEPRKPQAIVTWQPPKALRGDLSSWQLMDLKTLYNLNLTDVIDHFLTHTQWPAEPASTVGAWYRDEHFKRRAKLMPSDAAWRAKIDEQGTAWTADGIPFKTCKEGPNLAAVSLSEGFPARVSIPVDQEGKQLYLMISGITFPAQSHITNLRMTLHYADGTVETKDLVNPFTIGDCWGTWLGRCHDTAVNGFENLGGRYGPAGSCEITDLTQPVAVDTEAHLVKVDLRPHVRLDMLTFEAIANDVVFGLMGVSILKEER